MQYFFGIYGYEITRAIQVGPFLLRPCSSSLPEENNLATDSQRFHLTAIGTSSGEISMQSLFDLSAALTFCQQQWVEVTRPLNSSADIDAGQMLGQFPLELKLNCGRPAGELLMRDSSCESSRQNLLELCLQKLNDASFEETTGFRSAFFRHVESWRLRQPFVDLTYYLDFSALEILARTAGRNQDDPIAQVTTSFLKQLGFDVKQDDIKVREKSMQTYAHLRNALFHNGQFEYQVKDNAAIVTLKLLEFEDYFRRLVPDVLLKVLGFNDGHINWNRWLDRQTFT